MSEKEQSAHSVTLENRKKMLMTGIVEVVSSLDKAINAKTGDSLISITGSSLRVAKLNLEEGTLIVEGQIDGFKYSALSGGKSFMKRLFK